MSQIRGKQNLKTEILLVNLFRNHRIRGWRRGSRLIGRPDFVFPSERVALFVDGCFWHGCSTHGTIPATNELFWLRKLSGNRARDRRVNRALRDAGWCVIRVWQHELTRSRQARCISRIQRALSR
jgi:DNA mismatch endonuclease (patch repair protein)